MKIQLFNLPALLFLCSLLISSPVSVFSSNLSGDGNFAAADTAMAAASPSSDSTKARALAESGGSGAPLSGQHQKGQQHQHKKEGDDNNQNNRWKLARMEQRAEKKHQPKTRLTDLLRFKKAGSGKHQEDDGGHWLNKMTVHPGNESLFKKNKNSLDGGPPRQKRRQEDERKRTKMILYNHKKRYQQNGEVGGEGDSPSHLSSSSSLLFSSLPTSSSSLFSLPIKGGQSSPRHSLSELLRRHTTNKRHRENVDTEMKSVAESANPVKKGSTSSNGIPKEDQQQTEGKRGEKAAENENQPIKLVGEKEEENGDKQHQKHHSTLVAQEGDGDDDHSSLVYELPEFRRLFSPGKRPAGPGKMLLHFPGPLKLGQQPPAPPPVHPRLPRLSNYQPPGDLFSATRDLLQQEEEKDVQKEQQVKETENNNDKQIVVRKPWNPLLKPPPVQAENSADSSSLPTVYNPGCKCRVYSSGEPIVVGSTTLRFCAETDEDSVKKGGTGTVVKAWAEALGKCVAVKRVRDRRRSQSDYDSAKDSDLTFIVNEIEVLEEIERRRKENPIEQPFDRVIQMIDYGTALGPDGLAYVMVVEELGEKTLREYFRVDLWKRDVDPHFAAGMSLFELMEQMEIRVDGDELLDIARECTRALVELHTVAMHLDLKSANIMLVPTTTTEKAMENFAGEFSKGTNGQRRVLKLIDFGGSALLSQGDPETDSDSENGGENKENSSGSGSTSKVPTPRVCLDHRFGTQGWMAPEQLEACALSVKKTPNKRSRAVVNRRRQHYVYKVSPKTDIWAMGVLIYWLVLTKKPFPSLEGTKISHSSIPAIYRRERVALLNNALVDTDQMFDDWASAYVRHFPMFLTAVDACLQQNPKDRPTARGLLDYLDGRCQLHAPKHSPSYTRRLVSLEEALADPKLTRSAKHALSTVIADGFERQAREDAQKQVICEH